MSDQIFIFIALGLYFAAMLVIVADSFNLYSLTVLEAIVIGLGLLWLTTLVRVLAVLTPDASRPSARWSLLRG